jgi:hypothetical protein
MVTMTVPGLIAMKMMLTILSSKRSKNAPMEYSANSPISSSVAVYSDRLYAPVRYWFFRWLILMLFWISGFV